MTFPGYILADDLPRNRASHLSPSLNFLPRGLRLRLRERDRLRERLRPPPLTLMREASTWLCLSPSSCVELK